MTPASSDVRLRPATAADAEAFATVFLDCWRVSYAATMPAALVARVDDERAREIWGRALVEGGSEYLAAERTTAPGVLGFVGFRLVDAQTGYVSSLYVSPHAQGTGAGRALLARAEDELRSRGARTARLWVFEQNLPSRAFYERGGWRPDGTRETAAEWGEPQIGMSRPL